MVIQFVVVTNGAGRVAEVGARFTLDAMPGKQMAIDADLNSGLIDDDEARRRRADVSGEADFYGAMDGASKFVKGDAIAAIIITVVNLLGGFTVGMVQKGMSLLRRDAHLQPADHRRRPGLPDPRAAALRRHRPDRDPGDRRRRTWARDLVGQLTRHKQPMRIAGVGALGLCLIPGIPKLPFLLAGGAMLLLSSRHQSRAGHRPRADRGASSRCPRRTPSRRSSRTSGSTRSRSSSPPT